MEKVDQLYTSNFGEETLKEELVHENLVTYNRYRDQDICRLWNWLIEPRGLL